MKEDSLPPHQLGREHPALLCSLAVRYLLIHLPPLMHDQIQHILGVIHLRIRLGQELVNRLGEQLDVSSSIPKDIVEE
jgi:hypothetical protein